MTMFIYMNKIELESFRVPAYFEEICSLMKEEETTTSVLIVENVKKIFDKCKSHWFISTVT